MWTSTLHFAMLAGKGEPNIVLKLVYVFSSNYFCSSFLVIHILFRTPNVVFGSIITLVVVQTLPTLQSPSITDHSSIRQQSVEQLRLMFQILDAI